MIRSNRRAPIAVLLAASLAIPALAAEQKPALFHSPPLQAYPNEPIPVEGLLVAGAKIQKVLLRVRGPKAPYETIPMELQYGDLYRAVIPAEKVKPPGIEYCAEGVTKDGRKVPLFMTEARPARVLVVTGARPPKDPATVANAPPPAPEPEQHPVEPTPPPEPKPRFEPIARAEPPPRTEPFPRTEPKQKEPPPREKPPAEPKTSRPPPTPPPPVVEAQPEPARPKPARPPSKPRTELEEDLALYSAEDRVVVAVQREEKASRVPAFTTSVGREQMVAMGARTVAEVLSLVPGITISRDVAGFYRVGVRGLRSDPEVLFLLNGHALNHFYDGKALWNLPVENLERIEVIRGPGTALHGGAFLAAVNLITRTDEGVSGAASGGMFQTFDGHVVGMKPFGDLKVFGDIDANWQEGEYRQVARDSLATVTLVQGYRDDALDPAGKTRDNRLLLNVGAGASYENEAVGKLGLSARFLLENRSALVGMFDTLGNDSNLGWRAFLADLSYERPITSRVSLRGSLSFDDQLTQRLFQMTPGKDLVRSIPGFNTFPDFNNFPADSTPYLFPEGVQEHYEVGARTFGAQVVTDAVLADSNRLAAGVVAQLQALSGFQHLTNYYFDRYILHRNALTPFPGIDQLPSTGTSNLSQVANRLGLSLFAEDQWAILAPLTLTFGFRVDMTQVPHLVGPEGAKTLAGQELAPSFNPRVGVVYVVNDALALKLSYSRATRPPTIQELTDQVPDVDLNRGRFMGAIGLKAPSIQTVELGGDLLQVVGETRVRLRGQLFYENLANAIAQVDISGNLVPVTNRLGIQTFGAEAEARVDVSRRVNVWINVSWFRAFDDEPPAGFELLTDLPQGRLNAGLSIPIGELLNFDLAAELGTERRNNSRARLEALRRYRLPPYNLVTAQLRTDVLWDHVQFAAVCRNVFQTDLVDDAYRPDRMSGGVPREGLSALLTVRATY